MLNALRLVDGFTLTGFEATTGLPPSAIDAPLAIAIDRGWLQRDADRVVPIELVRRFTNDVVALFLED